MGAAWCYCWNIEAKLHLVSLVNTIKKPVEPVKNKLYKIKMACKHHLDSRRVLVPAPWVTLGA